MTISTKPPPASTACSNVAVRNTRPQSTPDRPLLEALVRPECVADFDVCEWNLLLRQARQASLLPRLSWRLQTAEALGAAPRSATQQLRAADAVAAHHRRCIRWEVNRIERALVDVPTEVALLKGAAYVMSDLPAGCGRLVSDIDVLVPRGRLEEVEAALRRFGWGPLNHDEYDDYYYRTWMHELPPLQHRERGTVIDVHHTILPPTGRLHPDPDLLWKASRRIPGTRWRTLSPADMVLHSAAHLFQDGDLNGGLRDLIDLDSLLRRFGETEPDFWPCLVERAATLNLGRPLYYALRLTQRLLETPVPVHTAEASRRHEPPWVARTLMDRLACRALLPDDEDGNQFATTFSRLALYVRSHWLRMPPALLARHLCRKSLNHWLPEGRTEE